jgi:DNA-binding response OmpR family regulator
VLVVEHHGDLATALWRFLKGMGHEVEVATSLRTARSMLQETAFDVLLTDVRLPDGLCFFLFQEGGHRLPRFVATMSAYELEADVLAAYPCVRRHLTKMFAAEELEDLFAGFAEEARASA